MKTHSDRSEAQRACEALCKAYGPHADAREADALANLFAPDGVFDRLGTEFKGREAIRSVIAGRPAGVWTKHVCSNVRIEVGADGRGAHGTVDLEMERGQDGSDKSEKLRGVYTDRFVLTDEGWRFASRKVVLK